MFSHQNKFNNLLYSIGGYYGFTAIIFIAIIIVITIAIYIIMYYREKLKWKNKFYRYSSLIKKYTINMARGMSDTQVEYLKSVFQYNDELIDTQHLNISKYTGSEKWYLHAEVFHHLTKILTLLLGRTLSPKDKYYKDKEIWKMILFSIITITSFLPEEVIPNVFPWGKNWYSFSITYPLLLVSATYMHLHLFKKHNQDLARNLTKYASAYYSEHTEPTCIKSIGWRRDGSNAIMISIVYIGAHLYMKDFDPNWPSQIYIRNFIKADYVMEGEGFYHDGSFVTHTSLPGYGYPTSAYNDFILIATFYENWDAVNAINNILKITEHPTIKSHYGPWFTRAGSLSTKDEFKPQVNY
ncbi:ODV-E66-like protein [Glossina pallidipes salivary gland hypertrophy virus]|uniref:ODV-E66-like protein n=1 Tax=Glossina hytrovirus (isolate Glossina pallidipes/Ethiopia/Seibersdorf/-) TaxID=379529 RepID=Q1PBV4_GHVS|nr:ODV-E66-like protein [Glossina pallidipes salivary gland hypertrophy virus]ABE11606.2 ODV-E66-like protein [Glossina pallidipes salivary gland hypertrophy virus]